VLFLSARCFNRRLVLVQRPSITATVVRQMNKILLMVLTAVVSITIDADRTAGKAAAWCLVGGDSGRSCGYYTFEACLASRAGGSSHCEPNPNFSGNQPSAGRPTRSERRR
jgi:Protein of unknown function (DUF3551)